MVGPLAGVFHIHTRHSFDCLTSPARTVEWAKRHNIGVLGITDHNTIRGAQEAAESASRSGVQVIIGAEYATNHGDVIGLFLTEEIYSRDAFAVIRAIRDQGGISLLPHPYHGHSLTDELAAAVDLIEVFNARCTDKQNHQALALATLHNKPTIGGADAHFLSDIQSCICYLEAGPVITPENLLHAQRVWIGKNSPRTRLHWSQVIKGWKTGDRSLFKSHLVAALLSHMRGAVGENVWGMLRMVWKSNR